MKSTEEICLKCPLRQFPCGGPCACLADPERRDIQVHWQNASCPKGYHATDDGSARPRKMPPRTPEERAREEAENAARQLEIFHQLWREIHTDPTGSPELIAKVAAMLPCGECRAEYQRYCTENPPVFGIGWRSWGWTLHNYVSQRKGKPPMPYPAAAALYGW